MATGTADVAIMISGELAELEEAVGDRGTGNVYSEVVGIDPSANMLQVRPSVGLKDNQSHIFNNTIDLGTIIGGVRVVWFEVI